MNFNSSHLMGFKLQYPQSHLLVRYLWPLMGDRPVWPSIRFIHYGLIKSLVLFRSLFVTFNCSVSSPERPDPSSRQAGGGRSRRPLFSSQLCAGREGWGGGGVTSVMGMSVCHECV